MNLFALVIETGRVAIGSSKRSVTLAAYHDGAEVFRFDAEVEGTPKIGDTYDIKFTRREA